MNLLFTQSKDHLSKWCELKKKNVNYVLKQSIKYIVAILIYKFTSRIINIRIKNTYFLKQIPIECLYFMVGIPLQSIRIRKPKCSIKPAKTIVFSN